MDAGEGRLEAPGIRVVGLGPGRWSQLTIGALGCLLEADRIIFRTTVHPTVELLRARLRPSAVVESFDGRYEQAASFDALYADLVSSLLEAALAAPRPIVYAVPGHPLVGERSVHLLLAQAPSRGVGIEIVDGLSFLEPLLDALGIDPLAEALQLADGAALLEPEEASTATPWRPGSPRQLQTGRPLLVGQVYDRRVASACKLWLLERYPPDHEVQVLAAAGTAGARRRGVPLGELDHSEAFDHLTSVYVPALDPLRDVRAPTAIPYIAARLRAPDGCPWDREQTMESLKPHLLEEAFEAVAALDAGDPDEMVEELGDLLLLITMLAQIAEEAGQFDLPQVVETVAGKLIRRHPHVFGEVRLGTAGAVVQNWERIKARERQGSGSALDGVPSAMPALIASQVMQRKAAAFGFDWPDVAGVYAKLEEELREVRESAPDARLEEVGDLLFALVSLCRHLRLDAEEALRRANAKFRARFEAVEALCAARGVDLGALDAEALDALWREAKSQDL
jgi:tetrapyrrole methylase family protein/MazG family protein